MTNLLSIRKANKVRLAFSDLATPHRKDGGVHMRIRHISVRNFRGIKELDWALGVSSIFCLIGPGDSTKSTILEAIRRVFHPQWNLQFDDADFYDCSEVNSISIIVTLGALPDEFRDLRKYGYWLSGWDKKSQKTSIDPGDYLEDALRVRLTVREDLRPHWSVVKKDEDEGVEFRPNDRSKVAVSLIGTFSDRHLSWARGSILNQLTESEDVSTSLAHAGRAAKSALEERRESHLGPFDEAADKAESTARALGVRVSNSYKSQLDTDAVNVRVGGLSLHDGDMPLRQLGLGSKRMLTIGMQKEALQTPHITLFDEVEIGLEPHRIARLVSHLKEDANGQYFLTTHSPTVLRELTVQDLHIVHCFDGAVEVIPADKPGLSCTIQGKIRAGAEAFLAPKVIVCEGATEIGFIRGLDDHWIGEDRPSMAYQGVWRYNAGSGNKVRETAQAFKELHYDVAVMVDSDQPKDFSEDDAAALTGENICVVTWKGKLSIEERVFLDLPWAGVLEAFNLASSLNPEPHRVLDQVRSKYGLGFDSNVSTWADSERLRVALGSAAKASKWFKSVTKGRQWADTVVPHLSDLGVDSDLRALLDQLRTWVDRDAG